MIVSKYTPKLLYWRGEACCIDLVSAGTGEMEKRYGFINVNLHNEGDDDMRRSRKKSFDWYKEVIETNGASILE